MVYVEVCVEAVWDCGHDPSECVQIPPPDEMEAYLKRLEKELPKPKRRNYEKLKVVVTDGHNSDIYYVDYPRNKYWARRVRKALEKITGEEVIVVE